MSNIIFYNKTTMCNVAKCAMSKYDRDIYTDKVREKVLSENKSKPRLIDVPSRGDSTEVTLSSTDHDSINDKQHFMPPRNQRVID